MLGPKEIKVPSVKEVSLDNAVKTIRDANLKVGKKIKTSNEKIPEGYVIKTNPKAGKLVKEGAEIDIYVSSGKEKFSLSDYTGRSYEEVYDLLNNQKLKFKDIK